MSSEAPIQPPISPGPSDSGYGWLAREAVLAGGLVVLILSSMWLATGTFPPMVVVESKSMMHDEDGSVGSIDPGDLVLVMNMDRTEVVTFVEATQFGNENFGYESHGMPGDVIIYKKNGGSETPVIHRALLEVKANSSGGWDVPGTTLVNVENVSLTLDIDCRYHGGTQKMEIEKWIPPNEGFLTAGDNNGCMIDQPSANSQGRGSGLVDSSGNPVLPIKEDWIVGVASSEIPWIGAIKLLTSGNHASVTSNTWNYLTLTILLILASPLIFDYSSSLIIRTDEEE
ncbi:MAG: S26 family signal peptidase [Candidatus Thermoplasmatota archaeon]|nr:S26 family signal peptidase [Candidatus Thermoplasmatota archaeon]MED5398703.1 S26 family signal peptidase [Candidatus Thermoplasmatota archaeon]